MYFWSLFNSNLTIYFVQQDFKLADAHWKSWKNNFHCAAILRTCPQSFWYIKKGVPISASRLWELRQLDSAVEAN